MVAAAQPLEVRGPMAQLYSLPFQFSKGERVTEIMFDSPRGTGKTVGDGATLVDWCLDYPGSRFLVARQALANLRSTWQVTFEQIVLPRFGIDPGMVARKSESQYVIGESLIQLRGLDDPQKARSFECNASLFIEGNEIEEGTYEDLRGALRWASGIPAHFSFIECNPDSPGHWAYKRWGLSPNCGEVWTPGRVRMQPRHKDNPAYWDIERQEWTELGAAYRHNLRTTMSGVRFRRLFEGEWAQAEGAIYDIYTESKHVLDAECVPDKRGRWWVRPKVDGTFEPIELLWFAAGQDWGFENPGVVQVWGFDKDLRMFMVEEVYQSKRDDTWWTEQIDRLHRNYDLWRVVSDPENAAGIAKVNSKLRARDGHSLLVKADKHSGQAGRKKFAQIMHTHSLLDGDSPRAFFLRGARQHQADIDLGKRPKQTTDELPGYTWKPPSRESDNPTDQPLKKNDHGCEAWQYLAWAVHQKDLSPPADVWASRPGSMGDLMGYDAMMDEAQAHGN